MSGSMYCMTQTCTYIVNLHIDTDRYISWHCDTCTGACCVPKIHNLVSSELHGLWQHTPEQRPSESRWWPATRYISYKKFAIKNKIRWLCVVHKCVHLSSVVTVPRSLGTCCSKHSDIYVHMHFIQGGCDVQDTQKDWASPATNHCTCKYYACPCKQSLLQSWCKGASPNYSLYA